MDSNQEQDSKSAILKQASAYVLGLYNQHKNGSLVFHNYALAFRRVEVANQLAAAHPLTELQREVIELSCWFLNMGCVVNYEHATQQSIRELGLFFKQTNSSEALRKQVVNCMQVISLQRKVIDICEQIVADASTIAAFLPNYETRMKLLRKEWELQGIRQFEDQEWLTFLKNQLSEIQLYTAPAKIQFESTLGQLLIQIDEQEKKKRKKQQRLSTEAPFQQLENGVPLRGAQTFFRTNYRNHINLSAIADNKANIMISVNAILISVLITFLSYRNIGINQPKILLPVILFLVTGLSSLIFAVLASRPKITRQASGLKRNIIFFGNFVQLSLDDFETAMDQVLKDEQALYGNMVRDLYYLGKVLDKKYRYLKIAYNIFMVGFIGTVLAFLAILFLIP